MRLGARGTSTLEFAMVASLLFTLMFAGFEFARLQWTWQAMQLAGDQTARCVAIGGSACGAASSYAVSTAHTYGAAALVATGVTIDTTTPSSTSCVPPTGNTAVRVQISLAFTSPFSTLVPAVARTLTTLSCYPLSGN